MHLGFIWVRLQYITFNRMYEYEGIRTSRFFFSEKLKNLNIHLMDEWLDDFMYIC